MDLVMAACWLLPPAAYLFGSVSPAYLIGRLNGIDLRQHGSGNLGATNAGRVLGMRYFLLVFALDMLKGLLPVLLARHLETASGSTFLPLATAAGVLLGHTFTCFHGFKGGKAVATSLGVLLGLVWVVAVATLGAWIVTWLVVRYVLGRTPAGAVAPASIMGALTVPVATVITDPHAFSWGHLPVTALLFSMSLLVIVRHRANLARMFSSAPAA